MKIEEIRIPAPWGHIAVKLWGDDKNQAIIVVHGVLDNAGAFDNLIPHLPDNFYYICVDLPGHGRSSPFHMSLPIHTVDYIVPLKIIADHFKREKYIFMAHSLGGQISAFFTQAYPERVSKLILVDSIYLFAVGPQAFVDTMKSAIDRLFKTIEQSQKPKVKYSYEEAVKKIIDGRKHGKMTRKAAVPLVERMFEKVGEDEYAMNIDSRLKDRLYPSGTMDYLVDVHREKPISCPVLVLLSTERGLKTICGPVYKLYIEYKYEVHIWEGHHDMHNTNPEIVAPFIVNFLLRDKSKL